MCQPIFSKYTLTSLSERDIVPYAFVAGPMKRAAIISSQYRLK